MKTTWVLTEDDKTKLGARLHPSGDIEAGDQETVNIKTEEVDDAEETDKQPSSSPMSFKNGPGGIPRPYSIPSTGYPPIYPAPTPSYSFSQPPAGIFPANINSMHVSLSGPNEGLSLRIETSSQPNTDPMLSPRPFGAEEYPEIPGPSWHNTEEQQLVKKQKRHHQQSRTIFRCVSNENMERDCDSRSTVSSQLSDYSALGERERERHASNKDNSNEDQSQPQEAFNDQFKAQVWKLRGGCFDDRESPLAPLSVINTFTLQETLFIEQLTAIDERVRFQVPMEVSHGNSFLECAISGSPISQMTIVHAYQTCIKRIVRFANSLQDFVELPPDDMQKLLVHNTVSIINIKIARWLNEGTDLKAQMFLLGTSTDLYQVALDSGKLAEDLNMKVGYSDIFISPWCCDSSHEDRYEKLIGEMSMLEMDSTTVVLLSVMSLFFTNSFQQVSAANNILSHQRKFSLLLQRYLLQSKGKDRTPELFLKYQESLEKLHEMAEILINKRLIC